MTEIGSKLPSDPSTTAAMPIQQEARQNATMESVPSEENDAGGSLGEHQEAIRLLQHLRDSPATVIEKRADGEKRIIIHANSTSTEQATSASREKKRKREVPSQEEPAEAFTSASATSTTRSSRSSSAPPPPFPQLPPLPAASTKFNVSSSLLPPISWLTATGMSPAFQLGRSPTPPPPSLPLIPSPTYPHFTLPMVDGLALTPSAAVAAAAAASVPRFVDNINAGALYDLRPFPLRTPFTVPESALSGRLVFSPEEDIPLECPRCREKFKLQSDLKKHLLAHASASPGTANNVSFTCELCAREFSTPHGLRTHVPYCKRNTQHQKTV